MKFGDNLRKEMPETAGQNFSKKAFLDKCGVVGETDKMNADNFPDYFAVVDAHPDQYIAQVPPAVFADQYAKDHPDSKNIMVSQKSLGSSDQMTMSTDQVFVLCNSRYVK